MRVFASPTLSARYPIGNPQMATTRDGRDMTIDARYLLVSSSTSILCSAGDTADDPISTIIDAMRSASFVSPEGLNCFPLESVNDMMRVCSLGRPLKPLFGFNVR